MSYQGVCFLRACPECRGTGMVRNLQGTFLEGYNPPMPNRCGHCGGGGRIEGSFDVASQRLCFRRLDTGQSLQVPVPAESPLIPQLRRT